MPDDVDVVRRLFDAVEARDLDRVLDCYSDDVEIAEAEVLPYGGVWRGREGAAGHAEAFMRAWGGLQGPEESRLDARLWGDGAGTVCAVFHHRARDCVSGERFDAPEVGIYRIRDGRVAASQMFHADSAAVIRFLLRSTQSALEEPPDLLSSPLRLVEHDQHVGVVDQPQLTFGQ